MVGDYCHANANFLCQEKLLEGKKFSRHFNFDIFLKNILIWDHFNFAVKPKYYVLRHFNFAV